MSEVPIQHATRQKLQAGVAPRVIYGSASGRPIYEGFFGNSQPFPPAHMAGVPPNMVAIGTTQLVAAQPIPTQYIPGFNLGDRWLERKV